MSISAARSKKSRAQGVQDFCIVQQDTATLSTQTERVDHCHGCSLRVTAH